MRNRSIVNLLVWGATLGAAVFAEPAAKADFTVLQGYDLFATVSSETSFDFGTINGSNVGNQSLMGVQLGTYNFGSGAVGVDNADTIIQRTQTVTAPGGSTGSTALIVNALQLETVATDTIGGKTGHLFVTLDPGVASTGLMNITFNGTGTGGTFTTSLNLTLNISFGNTLATSTILEPDISLTLNSSSTAWGRTAPAGADLLSGINYKLDGSDTSADFWPNGDLTDRPFVGGPPDTIVDAASVPEPSTGLLGTMAVMIGVACAALKRRCTA
jgi:hypothetical protein